MFPALKSTGLSDAETRRAWVAFPREVWQIAILLRIRQEYVMGLEGWQLHSYEGYRPVTIDVTAFWRPALQNCPSRHYHPVANWALPAVIFGIVGQVGELNGQRIALPRAFERVHPKDPSEKRLWADLLKQVKKGLAGNEIAVLDAGVKVSHLQDAEIKCYVLRLAKNFTARRNFLPEHGKKGRKPSYGALVRPLNRTHKNKTLTASSSDETITWQENGNTLKAEIWRSLVLNKTVPSQNNKVFDVYLIHDPDFDAPWLLATPVKLQAASVRAIYRDRWPVEQIPLSAKQMVGAHRQFVHAEESVQRLPELALLAPTCLIGEVVYTRAEN